MIDISKQLDVYRAKWMKYFSLKDWEWDDDLLYDTILKCEETISRLGLRDGEKESWNYLFKALNMNYKREREYARNKYRDQVEDINDVYETYLNKQPTVDYKMVNELWTDFQIDYILKWVDFSFDKKSSYLFRLKFVLCMSDADIRKKSKNPNWKKDIKEMLEWAKLCIKQEDIRKDFLIKYPDVDLDILTSNSSQYSDKYV